MQIETGKKPGPRRTLLYGEEGVGKSTFFACFRDSVFIPTEDGTGDIDCHRLPFCTSFEQVMAEIRWLYESKHEYKHVTTDSLDWLEKLIHAEVCRVRQVATIADIKYQAGYDFALPHWRAFLDGMELLRRDRGMSIGFTAHARVEKFRDPTTESYERFVPGIHKSAAAMVQEWCDEIFFARTPVYVDKTDEGFGRKKVTGKGSNERVMFTTARPSYVAKNRLNLPHEMPLAYATYAEYLAAAK